MTPQFRRRDKHLTPSMPPRRYTLRGVFRGVITRADADRLRRAGQRT